MKQFENINAPVKIKGIISNFVEKISNYLNEKLIGIYLHGSLAMNCYNPKSSDIDLIIVTKDRLSVSDKQKLLEIIKELDMSTKHKGFDISIITLEVLENFIYPTPIELYFHRDSIDEWLGKDGGLESQRTDYDLAAHLVIVSKRGVMLFGDPIEDFLPEISEKYYFDSIAKDSEWSYNNISKGDDSGECRVPVYGVLNFCRVLAFIIDKKILSKQEGGQWALENLPTHFRPIIEAAFDEYKQTGTGKIVKADLLKEFANYAKDKIILFKLKE